MSHNISRGSEAEGEWIRSQLVSYNNEHAPTVYEPITLKIAGDQQEIIGGLNAVHLWNWIEVNHLWIDNRYRGQRLGTKLLDEIERMARERNCVYIKLNTFTFQAPQYYPKHGYHQYAVIENVPPGYNHHFFIKDLSVV